MVDVGFGKIPVGNIAALAAALAPGIPFVVRFTVGNETADYDFKTPFALRVIDVVVIKTSAAGGAGDTVTVKNGSTAITDAIDVNDADKTVSRPTTIDDAQFDVAAEGTLRVSSNDATNPSCEVYVTCYRTS